MNCLNVNVKGDTTELRLGRVVDRRRRHRESVKRTGTTMQPRPSNSEVINMNRSNTAHVAHRSSRFARISFRYIVFAALLMLASFQASAACSYTCLTWVDGDAYGLQIADVPGGINVAPNTPVGAPISVKIPVTDYRYNVTQGGAAAGYYATMRLQVDYSPYPGYTDIYPVVGHSGIGVRLFIRVPPNPATNPSFVGERVFTTGFSWDIRPPQDGTWIDYVQVSVQFINMTPGAKTGTITRIPRMWALVGSGTPSHPPTSFNNLNNLMQGIINGATLTTYTCDTSQTATNISLQPIANSALPSVGSTGGSQDFSIRAQCNGPLIFRLTFGALGNFENVGNSVLKNTQTGGTAAQGYGIQIVQAGTGAEIDASTMEYETTAVSTSFQKDFTARYYRSGAVATSGLIQSALVYTMDYL